MNAKHILRYAAAAVAATAAFACSKDDAANPGTPENPDTKAPFTITASIDDGSDTRISMDDDGVNKIELRWESGDVIYVSDTETTKDSPYVFTVSTASISADGKTAAFTCPNFPDEATPLYAVHQGNMQGAISPTYVSSSGYATLSKLPDYFLLYAKYDPETKKLAFKPLSAVLKIKATLPAGVSGTLSNIRIGSPDGSQIFYNGYYDITSGTAVRSESQLNNQVYLNGSLQIAENTETELFIMLNPGTELTGKSLEIDLVIGNNVCTAAIKGGGLEAGKCYPLTLGTAKWTVRKFAERGDGSAETPYEIENEDNLKALARAVRAGGCYSKYFRLMNPVTVTSSEAEPWLPIGTKSNSFTSHFDGNNQTVSGKLHLSDKDGSDLGFFGSVLEGSIKNLTIAGDIVYKGSRNDNPLYIGGIAGYGNYTPISGCTHKGVITVENSTITSGVYVGGIAGASSKNITDCTQQGGTITVDTPNTSSDVGGIAGYFYDSQAEMHTCRNESSITATGKTSGTYAGALVGFNTGKVCECSTFPETGLTVTVNETPQNPVQAVGKGNTVPCDKGHTARQ